MQKSLNLGICFGLCLIISIVCFLEKNYAQAQTQTQAQAKEDKQVKETVKDIAGEVSFLDKDFISIVYKREDDRSKEYEMMLYIDKDVILQNVRDNDLKNLYEDDVVKIEYVQIDKEGSSKRIAKRIRFVRGKRLPLSLKGFKE